MEKYFEDNRLVGSSLIILHDFVTEATNVVANNLLRSREEVRRVSGPDEDTASLINMILGL